MTYPLFFKRVFILAMLLNSPPLIALILIPIGLEPVLLIMSLAFWANIPLQLGLGNITAEPNIVYSEFGVMDTSLTIIITTVMFWVVCAAILSLLSLYIPNKHQLK
ncbi:hypothetical protein [Shewanella goraebulensis]|uniref:hypothetical protein n=1 Tax=Shewanella goraebulensis TaxID=3050637 RepID=UPI00254E82C9|nr:hypothetical protein [Shewanella goraebulensis]